MFTSFEAGQLIEKASPIQFMKAIKNEVELQGMRECHVRDGAAQAEFFSWLESELNNGNTLLTEHSIIEIQRQCRAKQKSFMGLSFGTISSVGENAAVIHYSPAETGSSQVCSISSQRWTFCSKFCLDCEREDLFERFRCSSAHFPVQYVGFVSINMLW